MLEDPVDLAQLGGDVTGLVIRFFLYRLQEFIRRHLRRDYILRREHLNSRVRGKVMVQEYIGRSLPHLRDHIVPCQFSELSRDTLSNRILLWTLHLCARAVAAFPLEQCRLLLPQITARRQALSGITLTPIRLSDFGRVRYTGLHAVYRPIHALCRFICENFQFENVAGDAEFREFALDMNDLFERFVRGVLKSHLRRHFVADKRHLSRSYSWEDGSDKRRIELDGLVLDKQGNARCVVECKYREIWEPVVQEDDVLIVAGGKLQNKDIFQTIAYATHLNLRAPAAVLVYPVVGADSSIMGPLEAFGLRRHSDEPVSLFVTGINVGDRLCDSIAGFVQYVRTAAGV
jgi:5-methylcytosine-specific restriction enzyme subunit McrC